MIVTKHDNEVVVDTGECLHLFQDSTWMDMIPETRLEETIAALETIGYINIRGEV